MVAFGELDDCREQIRKSVVEEKAATSEKAVSFFASALRLLSVYLL